VQKDAKGQLALPKSIIRPWEELVHNNHRTGLGYDKDVSFHILDYSKLVQFHSVGFLHGDSPSPIRDSTPPHSEPKFVKFQHCDQVGHMKDHYFDIHPCKHCGECTHSSHRYFKKQASCKNKDSSWMDHLLAMGFNNQEDISHMQEDFFLNIEKSYS